MKIQLLLCTAALLASANAMARPGTHGDGDGFSHLRPTPRAEQQQPVAEPAPQPAPAVIAPAAQTYFPPATMVVERPPKPYALVAAPTLPCAPAYCPIRRARADRN